MFGGSRYRWYKVPYAEELSKGFPSTADAKPEYFEDKMIHCDNLVPSDYPDSRVAGKAFNGSTCYIACKDGYVMPDGPLGERYVSIEGKNMFKVECKSPKQITVYGTSEFTWFGMEWDIFTDVWDEFRRCNGYKSSRLMPKYSNCDLYPHCIPAN